MNVAPKFESPSPRTSSDSILETLVRDTRLSFMHAGVIATDLCRELVDEAMTLFAPLDAWFGDRLTESVRDVHDSERVEDAFDFFAGLAVSGTYDLEEGRPLALQTLSGAQLRWNGFDVSDGIRSARIVERHSCRNGILYLIDAPVSAGSQATFRRSR